MKTIAVFMAGIVVGFMTALFWLAESSYNVGYRQAFTDLQQNAREAHARHTNTFTVSGAPETMEFLTVSGSSAIVLFGCDRGMEIAGAGDQGIRRAGQ